MDPLQIGKVPQEMLLCLCRDLWLDYKTYSCSLSYHPRFDGKGEFKPVFIDLNPMGKLAIRDRNAVQIRDGKVLYRAANSRGPGGPT